jgi:hypothetical protein
MATISAAISSSMMSGAPSRPVAAGTRRLTAGPRGPSGRATVDRETERLRCARAQPRDGGAEAFVPVPDRASVETEAQRSRVESHLEPGPRRVHEPDPERRDLQAEPDQGRGHGGAEAAEQQGELGQEVAAFERLEGARQPPHGAAQPERREHGRDLTQLRAHRLTQPPAAGACAQGAQGEPADAQARERHRNPDGTDASVERVGQALERRPETEPTDASQREAERETDGHRLDPQAVGPPAQERESCRRHSPLPSSRLS